jgi:uroporphyrinogen-III synthase
VLLIVTRPPAQAAAWVRQLQALGQTAQALPLIDIAAVTDAAPLRAAWQGLAGKALVMFVSANAVAHFFALAPAAVVWPAGTRAGSTGPGTSAALRAAGVPEACLVEPALDAPNFDSEALWARLAAQDWAGRHALVVRGEDGRDWLAETLRERGAKVDFVAAYRRCRPVLKAAEQALLDSSLADPAACVWLLSSSEAVANLRALAPAADWSRSSAIASHPRIAESARGLGFGRVELAAPTPAAVVARLAAWPSIQSAPQ